MSSINSLADKALEVETGINRIFQEKGIVQAPGEHSDIPDERRSFRQSVAAVIVPHNWREFLDRVEEMPVGMGIQAQRRVLEFIGGGLNSQEEQRVEEQFAQDPSLVDERFIVGGKVPQYLYFLMQGAHVLDTGKLFVPTYDLRSGMEQIMGRELKREISEEAGDEAEGLITLGDVLPLDPKVTQLTTVGLGNMNAQIEEKLRDEGVQLTPDGNKLLGFLLEIRELGMLGTADLERLVEYAEQTEEVRGMVTITIGELLAKGEEAIANGVEGWNGWDIETQGNKPRNDSVFYLLRAFLEHVKQCSS
ncbi:MAG: hypothetical protein P1V18_04600 [Candidatus Gracilibacteria bacterium]|nr:hypothetical protein [Candidatus Gracilibacteria bacterium]